MRPRSGQSDRRNSYVRRPGAASHGWQPLGHCDRHSDFELHGDPNGNGPIRCGLVPASPIGGTHTFAGQVRLVTAGSRWVTATDTVTSSYTATQTVTVQSDAASFRPVRSEELIRSPARCG